MGEAEQHRFRLILSVMRQRQMKNAFGVTALGQEAIPRIPGRRLDARRRLNAVPSQNVMGDIARLQPRTDLDRLICGVLPQSMIDCQGKKRPATVLRP